jgi:drug/metabolite transporter (DMT)-like permease
MGYIFILSYILLIGIATFLMKVGLKTLSPYQLNFLMAIGMFLTGVPALLIAQKSLKIPTKELPIGLLIGIMMATGSILYVLALDKLSASVAAVLATVYVLIVVVLSWAFLKESFTVVKAAGVILTFAGVALLTWKA